MTKPLHTFDFKQRIPKLSKEELFRRIKCIVPCIIDRRNGMANAVVALKHVDPTNAFRWDDKTQEGEIIGSLSFDGISVKDSPGHMPDSWHMRKVCENIGEFLTLHGFGYYGFYKPSVEEVVAQLPIELFDEEKLGGRTLFFINEPISHNLNEAMLDGEYHIGRTKVFIQIK